MSPPSSSDAGKRSALLRFLILATLVVIVVALWYLIRYHLSDEGDIHWFAPERACELRQEACTTTLQMLPMTVRLEGLASRSAVVELVGRDMDMGLHRFPLAQDDGAFRGEGQVGVCAQAVMAWRANVVVDTPRGRLGTWFDFNVERGG